MRFKKSSPRNLMGYMRRISWRSRLEAVTIALVAAYVIQLSVNRTLTLYIHPRYSVFTVVLASVGLLLICLGAIFKKPAEHGHTQHQDSLRSWTPLLFMLFFIVLIPARSLSSATVSQRATDSASFSSSKASLQSMFSGSSKGLMLADWFQLITTNTDASYYKNKPVHIRGFIYDAGLGPDTVWLAQFVVTCCAVDAQPIGVPVAIPRWRDTYKQDQWLEVEGEFQNAQTAQGEQLVLQPKSITAIEQPRNPYAQ